MSEFLAHVLLVITATLLFYAALTDLREFKIRNDVVLILACLYGLYAYASGEWVNALSHVGLALAMFVVTLFFYACGWLGGGDVKILTVGFLWVGLRYALPFSLLLMFFSVSHIVMAEKFAWVAIRRVDGRAQIPFGPSVAAALIGIFVLKMIGF